jgi:hypothetical protein
VLTALAVDTHSDAPALADDPWLRLVGFFHFRIVWLCLLMLLWRAVENAASIEIVGIRCEKTIAARRRRRIKTQLQHFFNYTRNNNNNNTVGLNGIVLNLREALLQRVAEQRRRLQRYATRQLARCQRCRMLLLLLLLLLLLYMVFVR